MKTNLFETLKSGLGNGLVLENKHIYVTDGYGQRLKLLGIKEDRIYVKGLSLPQQMNKFIPYLFDLADLVNPITINGNSFVPLDNLNEMIEHTQLELMYDVRGFSFQNAGETFGMVYELREVFDKLNEWHFNIHGITPDQFIRVTPENSPYK